jgi:hypothetical protein
VLIGMILSDLSLGGGPCPPLYSFFLGAGLYGNPNRIRAQEFYPTFQVVFFCSD